MKNFIFGFIAGSAVSGAAVYFIMKKKFDKEKEEIVDTCEDTIVKIRQYYSEQVPKKADVIKEEPSEIVKKYHDISETYNTQSNEVVTDKIITKEYSDDPADYESPIEDDEDTEYEEGMDPEDMNAEAFGREAAKFDKENGHRPPERIVPDDFGNAPGFEAKEYTYYVEDDTYCDDYENLIDDEVFLFGTAIDTWSANDSDTDPIYIRNYAIGVDFKIDKMFCHCPMNPENFE